MWGAAMQAGRLKVVESHASVYVRVCDAQRMGSVEGPANEAAAQPFLRLPSYVQEGSRVQYDMQTLKTGGRTYDNARWVPSASLYLQEGFSLPCLGFSLLYLGFSLLLDEQTVNTIGNTCDSSWHAKHVLCCAVLC